MFTFNELIVLTQKLQRYIDCIFNIICSNDIKAPKDRLMPAPPCLQAYFHLPTSSSPGPELSPSYSLHPQKGLHSLQGSQGGPLVSNATATVRGRPTTLHVGVTIPY